MFKKTTETNLAALKIQKNYRSYRTRKQYAFSKLSGVDQLEFPALVVGNDPIIHGLEKYKINQSQTALVGTSGLRSVLLACELGNLDNIPKLIIIDNSKEVYQFWNEIRKFFNQCSDQKSFLSQGDCFFETLANKKIIVPNDDKKFNSLYLIKYPSQDPMEFLVNLFSSYGYNYVKAMIQNASFVCQSWANTSTIRKIKNALSYLKIANIFAYPSNIVTTPIPCCHDCYKMNVKAILSNIALLQPNLTIHTNCIPTLPRPTEVYLLEQTDLNYVMPIIFTEGLPDINAVLIREIKRALLFHHKEFEITMENLEEIICSKDIDNINTTSSIPDQIRREIYDTYHTTLKNYQGNHLYSKRTEEYSLFKI